MKISMECGQTSAELSSGPWDVALVGTAVDERGKAAIEFVTSRAGSTLVLQYHAGSFRLDVDHKELEVDELLAHLPDPSTSSFVLESTTLGFVEVFLACRTLIAAGAKTFC